MQKTAIVGTPCQIMAASKIEKYTQSPINYKIGLFCMENFSYKYFKEYLKQEDIELEDIKKFQIDKGKMQIQLEDYEFEVPISQIKNLVRKNCNICVELTSENSDISIGSIASKENHSTVIIRTPKGEELIEDAIKDGYIEAEELTHGQYNLLKKIAENKINKNLNTIDKRESLSRPILYQRPITTEQFMQELQESNFDDLQANVIDIGSCVLCGACEYICPDNIIKINDTKPIKRGKCSDDCHACFMACPRTYLPPEIRNDNTKALGNYTKILTVKTKKNYNGQDGSVVTTILNYLLDTNKITNAIVVDKKDDNPWKPLAKLTNQSDEIIKSAGTKYSVCPVFKALKQEEE